MTLLYVDTSAVVKRLVEEEESEAFERFLRTRLSGGDVLVSSVLIVVELHRFAMRVGVVPRDVATVLRNISTVSVSQSVITAASRIQQPVKSLDAIHLGSALVLRGHDEADPELTTLVTYDTTMARVGSEVGFDVLAPRD